MEVDSYDEVIACTTIVYVVFQAGMFDYGPRYSTRHQCRLVLVEDRKKLTFSKNKKFSKVPNMVLIAARTVLVMLCFPCHRNCFLRFVF